MRLQPRQYQVEAVNSLYQYFQNSSGNPLIAMPTGTGKSVVIAMFMESIFHSWPNQKVLCLTHVKELIRQNYDELVNMWPTAPAGVYSSGLNKRDTKHSIIFAGIASVAKKAAEFGNVDLVLIDEAHLVSTNTETMYQKFLSELLKTNSSLKVIGLTATPWRLGAGHLTNDGIFTDVAFDITGLSAFNRLIQEGFLAPLIPKQTTAMLDVSGVHMQGGEFIQKELQQAVDKEEITERAVREICEYGADRKHWLIFASGVEHADHIVSMLGTFGIDAISIHSKMTDEQRDQGLRDFKAGKYRCAVNMNVLTTGFNFPAIDLIGVLRPTASTVLWVQMLGRGTRPCEGKDNCLVLDFAGNTRRLGPINDPVIPRKKGDKIGGAAPVKLCNVCQVYNHASVRQCSFCGAEFTFQTKLQQIASTAELIKQDTPIVEVFTVEHLTYLSYQRKDRPPMLRASYYCKLKMFSDYVCLEHEGFAGRKAREWWRERGNHPIPATVDEALERTSELKAPTHIRVWINKKFPEIMAYCYDGSRFGEININEIPEPIQQVMPEFQMPENYFSDDIPF